MVDVHESNCRTGELDNHVSMVYAVSHSFAYLSHNFPFSLACYCSVLCQPFETAVSTLYIDLAFYHTFYRPEMFIILVCDSFPGIDVRYLGSVQIDKIFITAVRLIYH
jgi:hypothetical protein